jgi:hypothetical protein
MRSTIRHLTRVSLVLCIALCAAEPALADGDCGGVHVPAKVEAFGKTLVLNGAGIRRATFLNVHVYVAGLYLEQPTHEVARILEPARTKQIALHFVRNVSRKEMLDAIREGVENNAGAKQAAAEKHMQSLEHYLPDLKAGTLLSLAYQPQTGLEVRQDGKLLGSEKSDEFATLLFRVWLGPKPPDAELKAGLLGAPCE